MSDEEISSLKEALINQLQTIGRLYNEIEVERKASSSGVDEVLTVILHLQKEIAREKIEAFQYIQMAELRLQHAEESLAFLEELVYIKDIEIESLKSEVWSYQKILQNVELNEKFRFTISQLLYRAKSCIQIKRHASEPTISRENSYLLPKVDTILEEIGEKVKHICLFVNTKKIDSKRREIMCMHRNILLKDEIDELKYELEKLAKAARSMKQCYLLEGNEQVLKMIDSHIRSSKSCMYSQQTSCKRSKKISSMFSQQTSCKCSQKKLNKFSQQDKAIFASLTEAMLSFSN